MLHTAKPLALSLTYPFLSDCKERSSARGQGIVGNQIHALILDLVSFALHESMPSKINHTNKANQKNQRSDS
jgi:hypothetical protein